MLSSPMRISERQAHADHDVALDWVELVGVAVAREGLGADGTVQKYLEITNY